MILDSLVGGAIRRRGVVALGTAVLLALGLWALSTLPFEAFPDITANSVTVIAEAPGLAPQEVEQLVTFPIERSLLGLPRTQVVRSTTKLGLSITQVIFDDGVDTYFARQQVGQRLADAQRLLPPEVVPVLGPVSTAMGEVFQYVLVSRSPEWTARELKTLQDYTLAPQLRTVPGVADVNSWGGLTERWEVIADPARLAAAGLTLGQLEQAIAEANANFGGASVETRGERLVVRGLGRLRTLDDLAQVPVPVAGRTLRIADIATVQAGALPRQGAVTKDGAGDVVSGMIIMRKGENARTLIRRVRERVDLLAARLPAGVELVPFYDQSELVGRTTHTLQKNLLLGGALVITLLWLFLRNAWASLIVALVIPLSMLWAFIAMRLFGFSANLMSLGALDFGLLVDGSVVLVENIMHRAGESGGPETRVRRSAVEVVRPMAFGIAIIIAVYLPIFALGGTEGKLFIPMAFTVVAAVLGSLLIALTVVPAAARTFLTDAKEPHAPLFERFADAYARVLARTLQARAAVLAVAVTLVISALVSFAYIGKEFMPRLDEGSVLVQVRRPPSAALGEGTMLSGLVEQRLRGLPEVRNVVTKLGRPDLATEAMGTYESDSYVALVDRGEWRPGGKTALLAAMDSVLQTVPGISYAFTQPIQMRLDEAESGITTDVGLKLFGPDTDTLAMLARRVEQVLLATPGAAEVKAVAASRVKQLESVLDRAALGRLGVTTAAAGGEVERAMGARSATTVVDGARRIPVAVRVPDAALADVAQVGALPVPTAAGGRVPLAAVASVGITDAPEAFAHEGGERLVVVGANVRGRDVVSWVQEADQRLAAAVPLPPGYRTEWGGQYTHQRTAMRRLGLLVPLAVLLIFGLLHSAFGTVRHALLILLNVPFALVGGIAMLWAVGLPLSIAGMIGFIALFGIAVLNGVVLVSALNDLVAHGRALRDAVLEGARRRLRPVLMTASVAGLGFVPMAISQSPGAELQRPLALVVIGGLLTSTALTLLVLPMLYEFVERRWGGDLARADAVPGGATAASDVAH
jgi:cobalt-zinc-cadmium resistance protein CzcA